MDRYDTEMDELLQSLRESVVQAQLTPARTTTPMPLYEVDVRDSVRRLSRNRVSQIVRQLRASQGFTYEQVQTMTGLSQQLLFDVEYKDRRLTLEELALLAECYDVSPNDILGIDLVQ